MKSVLLALAITAGAATSAAAQQYTRVYSVEQSSLISSSSGVAAGYYLPNGRAYTAYGVPTTTYYPPTPPVAYTTYFAPGGPLILTSPPCTQPRNRLNGW
jgi:hypothetical protein